MESIKLQHPSGATAAIYPYGAHLHSWRTAKGREWIFMSSQALLESGKAIRGGVPIIFPQFNEFGPGKRHGFARTLFWEQVANNNHDESVTELRFRLSHSAETLQDWPHQFSATYKVSLTGTSLTLTLRVENTGDQVFLFTTALHSYFAISQLNRIKVTGLKDVDYWDNDGSAFDKRFSDRRDVLTINEAFDRVYFDVNQPVRLQDDKDCLSITQQGFRDLVIWNPGVSGATVLSDLGNDEFQHMLCIESAVIDKPICLEPGEQWIGEQQLVEASA